MNFAVQMKKPSPSRAANEPKNFNYMAPEEMDSSVYDGTEDEEEDDDEEGFDGKRR